VLLTWSLRIDLRFWTRYGAKPSGMNGRLSSAGYENVGQNCVTVNRNAECKLSHNLTVMREAAIKTSQSVELTIPQILSRVSSARGVGRDSIVGIATG